MRHRQVRFCRRSKVTFKKLYPNVVSQQNQEGKMLLPSRQPTNKKARTGGLFQFHSE